jgi:hypothetical protein
LFDSGDQLGSLDVERLAEAEEGVESGRLVVVLELAEIVTIVQAGSLADVKEEVIPLG